MRVDKRIRLVGNGLREGLVATRFGKSSLGHLIPGVATAYQQVFYHNRKSAPKISHLS